MVVIKGIKQCSCYELDDKEDTFLIEVGHPGRKREDLVFKREKVDLSFHPRAISG